MVTGRGSTTGQRLWSRFVGMDLGHRQGHGDGGASSLRLHLVNTHFMLVNEMPHGGLKASGYGKDLSMYALEDYAIARHVMVKL
jgi:acyl-CoA reductase-like NAD-dependent aldehyde dehydrogenase